MGNRQSDDDKSKSTKGDTSREERLAAELRANLKKRKDHMREAKKTSDNS